MNAAEYIVKELKKEHVGTVFGYQGGNIAYLIDAISEEEGISYVQPYSEQGAAFAADAYAQVSGRFGVAVSSGGPGAINMVNGIANAFYDSIPCLFLTGNVNAASMRTDDRVRQDGFQEADIVGMVEGITKFSGSAASAGDIPGMLGRALALMREGRPGPVLIDVPHNVWRQEMPGRLCAAPQAGMGTPCRGAYREAAQEVYGRLMGASRPVVLAGGGCRAAGTPALLEEFLDRTGIPAVTSLCGKDALPNGHPCWRGMIGTYGLPYSNRVLQEADFVLVLGSRMDEHQRAAAPGAFLKDAFVAHVDIDAHELGHVVRDEYKVHADVGGFLECLLGFCLEKGQHGGWAARTRRYMEGPVPEGAWACGSGLKNILQRITGACPENSVICVDVGIHQMAAAQAVRVGRGTRYLNSGGLGAMGYALPAAVGAYYAAPDKRVICITGDGGIMMNLQELQTVAREGIPVMVVVVNNHGLGMIEGYQRRALGGRLHGSRWGYAAPGFEGLAGAFGIPYVRYGDAGSLQGSRGKGPVFVEVEV